jgi:Protein of unknown function (DUF3489)
MTQEEITAIAESLRTAGLPDALNRWLRMTPEQWAENERVRARLARSAIEVHGKGKTRRRPPAGLPRSLEGADLEAVRGMLAEDRRAAEATKRAKRKARKEAGARLARYREQVKHQKESDMTQKIGTKEAALRDQRAVGQEIKTDAGAHLGITTDAPNGTTGVKPRPRKATGKAKGAAKAAKVAKGAAKAKPVPAASGAAKDGVRPGSKLALIVGLLRRPKGCTTKQVLEATGWPAVSMPQQAKAAGLTLQKEKVDGVTVYRA